MKHEFEIMYRKIINKSFFIECLKDENDYLSYHETYDHKNNQIQI